MSRLAYNQLDDEAVHLTQRGLYVEPLNYPLDENQFPKNGHEYIHLVRKEHAAIFPEDTKEDFKMIFSEKLNQSPDTDNKFDLNKWKKHEANFFSRLAIQLISKKEQLVKKYPKTSFPSVHKEKECCLFCLGSEIYRKIFKDEVENIEGNAPYLSIVLYFSQKEILILLRYMKEWSTVVGMDHEICRWIYALLACLRKPLTERCREFLEEFYDSCVQKIAHCDETEKNQLHLISSIIKLYFCIKAYKIGPPLSRFQKLH